MHPTQNPPVDPVDAVGSCVEPTPADVLRAAATYLERYGWITGQYFDHPSGQLFPSACTVGAVQMVVTGRATTDIIIGDTGGTEAEHDAIGRALYALASWLGLEALIDPLDDVTDWNDSGITCGDEVIRDLRAAADDYDYTIFGYTGGAR